MADLSTLLSGQIFPEDAEATYGQILPLKRTQQGGLAMAWPGMVHDAVNGVGDALVTPYNAMHGMSGDDLTNHGTQMALTLMGQGYSMGKPAGTLGIFGGMGAKTANTSKLLRAVDMEHQMTNAGIPEDGVREAVHSATGWFRGPDSKWRFEIPDRNADLDTRLMNTKAMINDEGKAGFGKTIPYSVSETGDNFAYGFNERSLVMSDVLKHPELYEAYPHLAELPIRPLPAEAIARGVRGAMESKPMPYTALAPNFGGPMLSTLLHETQHHIQDSEGFAGGGNSQNYLPRDFDEQMKSTQQSRDDAWNAIKRQGVNPIYAAQARKLNAEGTYVSPYLQQHYDMIAHAPELLKQFEDSQGKLEILHDAQKAAWQRYANQAGEVEARMVQDRHATGAYDLPPWTSGEHIPYEQQEVNFRK